MTFSPYIGAAVAPFGPAAETMPLMPTVNSARSWNSGVAFGPEPCAAAGRDGVYGAS